MLKIGPDGHVSDSAAVPAAPFFEQLADVKAELAKANAEVAELETGATGVAPDDAQAPDAAPEPAPVPLAPPRVPPRRAAPPGAAGG